MTGTLALLGSGEYLPSMLALEAGLLSDGVRAGKRPVFVQLATAAGRESRERLDYWRTLGAEQASRMDIRADFVPVFERSDAHNQEFVDRIRDAALVYFSGGDPHHLADSVRGTPLWEAVADAVRTGGSLAGCSAGAMFLSQRVPSLRFLRRAPVEGVGLLKNLQVIPHFNMIHRWIPDAAVRVMTDIPDGVTLVGIDDETAMVRENGAWSAWGKGEVHVLNGSSPRVARSGDLVSLD